MRRFWRRMPALLGVAGVASEENARARRWGKRTEVVVSLVTLWLPFIWYADAKGLLESSSVRFFDHLLWGIFAAEMVLLSFLVSNPTRYWRQNWLNLAIVAGGFPLLFTEHASVLVPLRVLRLLLLLVSVVRFARRSVDLLARDALWALLIVDLFLIVAVGTLVATIDPNIETLWDGMWWALVTVSTVGYGDVVPTSAEGRLFGVILILFGVMTFSQLTATLAKGLLSLQFEETARELEQEEVKHELLILQRLEAMEGQIQRLEAQMQALHYALERDRLALPEQENRSSLEQAQIPLNCFLKRVK